MSVTEALSKAQEKGNQHAQSLCHHALGALHFLMGDWAQSEKELHLSIDFARETESAFGDILGNQRLALLETRLGRFDAAHERLLAALELAKDSENNLIRVHSLTRLLGSLADNRYKAGDLAGATEYLAQGFAGQREIGECVPCDVLLYPTAVPIYIALDDLRLAEWACEKAEEAASGFGSRAWEAAARYSRGILATAQDDWTAAERFLREALELFESLQTPFDIARTLEALAAIPEEARLGGAFAYGRALQERAVELYANLGAAPAEERVREALAERG